MKITWFSDNVFRLYVGGQIIVTDPRKAAADIDSHELTAGADVLVDVIDVLPDLTAFTEDNWRRPKRKSMLDDDGVPTAPALFGVDGKALVLDSPDESRLIVGFAQIAWGRFADDAVVIVTEIESAKLLLAAARPKLIALAVAKLSDDQFNDLAKVCQDCALQVLEPGFALEA